MGKCENSKEFILSMGYAIHFADTPSTPLLFAPIFMVMGIDEASENARAVYSNAKTINTLMASVYYSAGTKEQSLVLRLTETTIDQLSKNENRVYKRQQRDNENSFDI